MAVDSQYSPATLSQWLIPVSYLKEESLSLTLSQRWQLFYGMLFWLIELWIIKSTAILKKQILASVRLLTKKTENHYFGQIIGLEGNKKKVD